MSNLHIFNTESCINSWNVCVKFNLSYKHIVFPLSQVKYVFAISHIWKKFPIGHENNDNQHAMCPIKFSSFSFSRNMIKVASKISADALVYTDSKCDIKKLKKIFKWSLKKIF